MILFSPFLGRQTIIFLESLGEMELVVVAALSGNRFNGKVSEPH